MLVVQKIKKRNGAIVDFSIDKIVRVVEKAFVDVLHDPKTEEAKSIAAGVTEMVTARYGGSVNFPNVEELLVLPVCGRYNALSGIRFYLFFTGEPCNASRPSRWKDRIHAG